MLKVIWAEPLKDLVRYKSFLLLMFIVCLADRTIKLLKSTCHLNIKLPAFWRISADSSSFILFQFPDMLLKKMSDPRLALMVVALFLLKRMIALWPASDMRRMHRKERDRTGILSAAGAIGWKSLAWYFPALLAWCGLMAAWVVLCFVICRLGWRHYPGGGWLWGLGIAIAAALPLTLAGLSFSSRLAVQSTGTFAQKIALLLKTCAAWRVAWRAWLFFLAWFVIEALFIAGTTIFILAKTDHGAIRFALAAVLATPFYAYLEMAAYKLFLVAYQNFPVVKQEYKHYYDAHRTGQMMETPHGPDC